MKIKSKAFENNSDIPITYTCDGENISPSLTFLDVPDTAVSLALIVDDIDAPGGEWVHWIVWNIDPKTYEAPEGAVPGNGIEGQTSFMESEGPVFRYSGPCPPFGTHRYLFKLYALTEKLNLSNETDKKQLLLAMEGKIIAEDTLTGLYSRA